MSYFRVLHRGVPHLSHPWFTNISTVPHLSFAFRSWPHLSHPIVIHILTMPHLSVTFRFLWPERWQFFSGHFSVRISEWATYTNFIHFGSHMSGDSGRIRALQSLAAFEPYSHLAAFEPYFHWPHASLTFVGHIYWPHTLGIH